MENSSPWRCLDSRIVYENPWIKVREDQVVHPDGHTSLYGVVMTPPSVYVVALTKESEVYIVGQYRYPTQKYSWELPAGGSEGQDPLEAAKRELWEETGLKAGKWEQVAKLQVMNGISDEFFFVFLAQELQETTTNRQAEDGINQMKKVPFSELKELIKNGSFDDGQSIAALTAAALSIGLL